MARAKAAANPSPKRASRSASSTASHARNAKKPRSGSRDNIADDWTPRDQEDALAQGWGVFDCIDMKTKKVFLVLQGEGKRFTNDNDARAFVKTQSESGDALATRALRAVFRSMAGDKARSK